MANLYVRISIVLCTIAIVLSSSSTIAQTQKGPQFADMVVFHKGKYHIGTNNGAPHEGPRHYVKVKSFAIDRQLVTVNSFRVFVNKTGYKTTAEKDGNAGVFNFQTGEWTLVEGANWEYPEGPEKPAAMLDHPVTQVSWHDAVAYCRWHKCRLPSSAEWEIAATNGGKEQKYAWGNYFNQSANIWTGSFPDTNTAADGYLMTSPVGKFGTNKSGLSDMGGNVWQWCSDDYKPYPGYSGNFEAEPGSKVLKGGSFLCDSTVCHGFRVSARSENTPETALIHVGFRCACDIDQRKKTSIKTGL